MKIRKTIITSEAIDLLIRKTLHFIENGEPSEEQAQVLFDILCDELLEILPGEENSTNRAMIVSRVLVDIAMKSGIELGEEYWF
jgi:hypothetical protein